MKGGHARSGPAPDPNALRRNTDRSEWVTLPAEHDLPVPTFPLDAPSPRELTLWAAMWRKPQATRWDALGQELEVALYCRRFAEAEVSNSPTNLSTLVRQMADSLGLTTPGLRQNRWTIQASAPTSPTASPVVDIRAMLTAVPSDAES